MLPRSSSKTFRAFYVDFYGFWDPRFGQSLRIFYLIFQAGYHQPFRVKPDGLPCCYLMELACLKAPLPASRRI